MTKRQTAPRLDEPRVSDGQRDGDPGGHERPSTSGAQDHPFASDEVHARVARVRVRRQRKIGIELPERNREHRHDPRIGPMLVWMDLEMTGLDPSTNVIVEIATLVTDDELEIVAEGPDLVIATSADKLAGMDPVVRDMHTRSGLLKAIEASTISLDVAGTQTLDFIREHVPEPRTVPLCGNSIGTDRRFLAVHLPEIEEYLHYRSIDVSTIKELSRRWYPETLAGAPTKAGGHRALDDVRESVAELRYWRETVFKPKA